MLEQITACLVAGDSLEVACLDDGALVVQLLQLALVGAKLTEHLVRQVQDAGQDAVHHLTLRTRRLR